MEKLNFRTIPGPKSAEIINISNQCEPRCAADQTPIVWDHGDGVWVWDVDGNPYIDFTSGVLVSNLGHNHPGLVSAIQKQAPRMMNCYSFPTPERVSASSRLVKVLPDNIDRVFMLSTGADATEAALRIARRYSGKQEILAFYGGFHGRTYGAMGVAGSISTRRGFGMPVPGGIMAPYAYCYRCFYGKTYPECGMFCLKALDRIIDSTSSGDLGAVIVEPYQGTAGFVSRLKGGLKLSKIGLVNVIFFLLLMRYRPALVVLAKCLPLSGRISTPIYFVWEKEWEVAFLLQQFVENQQFSNV